MFTARNVVLGVIAVFVASLAWGIWSLSQPPDSDGLGGDTYGTRRQGVRAWFEILTELGVRVERSLNPPTASSLRDATLVFWKPGRTLVGREPTYLHPLLDWVQKGGHIVVAPPIPGDVFSELVFGGSAGKNPETLFEALRGPEIDTLLINLNESAQAETVEHFDPNEKRTETRDETQDEAPQPRREVPPEIARIRGILMGEKDWQPSRVISVKCIGTLAHLANSVHTLEVPEERLQVLDLGKSNPQGQITFTDSSGTEQTLVAAYQLGQGQLTVIGPAALGENRLIAQQDNSVLVTQLVAGSGRPVVFDEFYHGLTVRGNPLWLFTRPGFGIVSFSLLLAVGMLIWRDAIFLGPPLAESVTSRRSIG